MNYIRAVVSEIQRVDSLNIVSLKAGEEALKMIALELDRGIHVGTEVILGAKATNISLAKDLQGLLSISNKIHCKVESMNLGELLCSVKFFFLDEVLESIITKDSAMRMKLQVGDEVLALIKSSELSIVEVL